MAYQIQFFCMWRGEDLGDFAKSIERELSSRDAGIVTTDVNQGDSWTALEVRRHPEYPVTMVLRFGDAAIEKEVARVSTEPDSPDLRMTNSLIELTLSGSIDWGLVAIVWAAIVDSYSGIPYDEESGFEASLE